MALAEYEVQVFTEDDSAVEFTLALREVPTIREPLIYPVRGRTQAQDYSLAVRDLGANIADGGRRNLLGRLARVRRNDAGAGMATLSTGRIANTPERDGPDSYRLDLSDERWKERRSVAFKDSIATPLATTCYLIPAGLKQDWRGYRSNIFLVSGTVVDTESDDRYLIRFGSGVRGPLTDSVLSVIRDDMMDAPDYLRRGANFKSIRLNLDGTDYPIISFGSLAGPDTEFLYRLERDGALAVWVHAPGAGWLMDDRFDAAFVHIPTGDPRRGMPYHLEGHPGQIVKNLYDQFGIRYNAAAMTAWIADTSYPRMSFRLEGSQNLARWLEDHVYAPNLRVPFINADGEIVPKSVRLPALSQAAFDALPTLTASGVSKFPTLDHPWRDAVTVVKAEYVWIRNGRNPGGLTILDPYGLFTPAPPAPDYDADGLFADDQVTGQSRNADTVDRLGKQELVVQLDGYRPVLEILSQQGQVIGLVPSVVASAESILDWYAREVFDRFADGPVQGEVDAMESASGIQPGDFFRLQLADFSNASEAGGRGGTRVVQALRRTRPAVGYDFAYLDAGPNENPLAQPTVAIIKNVARPKHDVDVTISNVPVGAEVTLYLGRGAAPSEWERIYTHDPFDVLTPLTNGTYKVSNWPAGATIAAYAVASAHGRIRSAPSATVSVALTALSTPGAPTAVVSGNSIQIVWANTETDSLYRLAPMRAGVLYQEARIPANSTAFLFEENPAGANDYGIKYVDYYGGESAVASVSATPAAGLTLAAPEEVRVRQGRASVGVGAVPSPWEVVGYGLEVAWAPSLHALTRWQLSTSSIFATVEAEFVIPAGISVALLTTKMDNTLRYARALFERDGWTESAWSSTVSAYPAPLSRRFNAKNAFPSGWASVRFDETGKVWLDIGSDDPESQRAYYEVSKVGFPTVTTADSFSLEAVWPASIDPGVTLARGETAYATVRFWNALAGLAPSITDSETRAADDTSQVRPTIERLKAVQGADLLHYDVSFRILDPNNLGGTLRVWTNRGSYEDADPTAAAQATETIASTPFDATPALTFDTGEAQPLNEIVSQVRRPKTIWIEFENSNAISTGRLPFIISPIMEFVRNDETKIDPDVALRDGKGIFRKALPTDADTLDSVPDSATYGKVKVTALTAGEVDLSKAGVIGRTLDNIANTASFEKTTPNEKTGAARAFAGFNASNKLVTAVASGATVEAGATVAADAFTGTTPLFDNGIRVDGQQISLLEDGEGPQMTLSRSGASDKRATVGLVTDGTYDDVVFYGGRALAGDRAPDEYMRYDRSAVSLVVAVPSQIDGRASVGQVDSDVAGYTATPTASVLNNATLTLGAVAKYAGVISVIDGTNSYAGVFVVSGASVTELSDPSGAYSITVGTASMMNLYVTGGNLTIENKSGGSRTFRIQVLGGTPG